MLLTTRASISGEGNCGYSCSSSFIMGISRSNSTKISTLWPTASNMPDRARKAPAASPPFLNFPKSFRNYPCSLRGMCGAGKPPSRKATRDFVPCLLRAGAYPALQRLPSPLRDKSWRLVEDHPYRLAPFLCFTKQAHGIITTPVASST